MEHKLYNIGDLVGVASNRVLGIITKSSYWALDEYLGGEIEMVDVMFAGDTVSKQFPVRYLVDL
tara:strand:- start:306 stop:497 length:192 start_codon:yes stop_codon:yes gene_type:complete